MQDKRESLYRIQLQFKTEQNRENNMYFSLINIAIVFMSTSSLSVHVSIIFCSLFEQKLLWFFFCSCNESWKCTQFLYFTVLLSFYSTLALYSLLYATIVWPNYYVSRAPFMNKKQNGIILHWKHRIPTTELGLHWEKGISIFHFPLQ